MVPAPSLQEVERSVQRPLYLRKVRLVPFPASNQTGAAEPQQAVLLQHGTTALPPNLTSWLDDKGLKLQVFDLSKNSQKQCKKLASWAKKASKQERPGSFLVVDLMALGAPSHDEPTSAAIELSTLRLHVAQALHPHHENLRWLSCTEMGVASLDANAGNEQDASEASSYPLLAGGATSGFVKGLAREWNVPCRVVDLSSEDLPESWLEQEWQDTSETLEVFYHQGQRHTALLQEEPAEDINPLAKVPKHRFAAQENPPVLVITGGGAGITARITEALARHLSFRALILGRTELPETSDLLPVEDKAKTRRMLRDRMAHDISPKELQAAFQRAEKQVRLHQQLKTYERLGVEWLYVPTDMNDTSSVRAAVEKALQKWGQVDAVIHGAGIDQSRDLANKTPDELQQVMSVKLQGLAHLQAALADQPVQTWMAFGSVSARFGNEGQVDYAAANEAMARWMLGSPLFSESLIIDYTAWDDTGMAASLATFMKERGVDMLPADTTSQHTAGLWLAGGQGEWVYSGRLPTPEDANNPLGRVQFRVPGREVEYAKELYTGRDVYLQDHRMGDTEIQPGVVSLAWMQRCAEELTFQQPCSLLRDISFGKAVKLFPNRPILMESTAHRVQPDVIQAGIASQRQRRGLTEHIHHATATFVLSDNASSEKELPTFSLKPSSKSAMDLSSVYETFFHGPTWQVLSQGWLNENEILVQLPNDTTALGQGLPGAQRPRAVGMELLLQGAGLWALRQRSDYVLPFAIQSLHIKVEPTLEEPLQARVRFVRQDKDVLYFDGILQSTKETLLVVQDLAMRVFPMPR
ncbi:MAG: SDR family NAD(P)-dependent oxidoreductase [Deltaproteobacteria bacterium]|nr:MAG: SDR family NAD(P)-dependent oxidoreductase [Deltaproteobacteria bacterium]